MVAAYLDLYDELLVFRERPHMSSSPSRIRRNERLAWRSLSALSASVCDLEVVVLDMAPPRPICRRTHLLTAGTGLAWSPARGGEPRHAIRGWRQRAEELVTFSMPGQMSKERVAALVDAFNRWEGSLS